MNHAVCCIPVSPLRKEPSHRSEMVSQVLFGEFCTVLEATKDHWIKVRCAYDQYEGWCQDAHVKVIDREINPKNVYQLTADYVNDVTYRGQPMKLPFGCHLPEEKETLFGGDFSCASGTWIPSRAKRDEKTIRDISFRFINTGYLWGGKSVFGIDCSGFSQTVFKYLGISLMRDAYQQASQGDVVGFLQEVKCGDLAFFDNPEGRITHVGILLNEHEIIHASTKVRVDNIDNQGIINSETSQRTHQLRIIKRYFEIETATAS
jgi:gamma-D-glutamyl-L-lysine dipeptidyl-peptidase